ncbi:MAG: alpha/beta hydrolase [Pseudomonadota bacterium]
MATLDAQTVWLDYDQAGLDKQYNSRGSVADFTVFLREYSERTRLAKSTLRCIENVEYGDGAAERLDIYPAADSGAPVLVFLHGGDWRALSKEDSGFPAPTFVAAGATVVVPDFDLVPNTTIPEMGVQVRWMLDWVARHIGEHGGDRSRIFIAGHSSGANLVSQLLACDWMRDFGQPADLIKGAVFMSGLGDLEPVRRSFRNTILQLDEEMVRKASLLRQSFTSAAPMLVAVSDGETAEYQRQAAAVADFWRSRANACELHRIAGCNHFDGVLAWTDPASALFRATLGMMGLAVQESSTAG